MLTMTLPVMKNWRRKFVGTLRILTPTGKAPPDFPDTTLSSYVVKSPPPKMENLFDLVLLRGPNEIPTQIGLRALRHTLPKEVEMIS